MFFFCSTPNLRGPSADRQETLPHDRDLALLYNPSPKIQGAPPPQKKILGAKNMQNFGGFFATSDFDCEYLRNGLRYPNQKETFSRSIPPAFYETDPVNFGPLISEISMWDWTQKCTFWGYYISAKRGVLRPEIFARTRDWPRLPSAHPNWDGGPPKNFNREN